MNIKSSDRQPNDIIEDEGKKELLIQGKDCTKSWRQASKRLINYLIAYFPIFVFCNHFLI